MDDTADKRLAELLFRMSRLEQRVSRLSLDTYAIQRLVEQEHIPFHWLSHTGDWSLDAGLLVHITEVLHNIERPTIIEFGTGYGSKILAKLCANRGGRLIGVEHDPQWHQIVLSEIQSNQLQEHATLQLCPLKQMYLNGIPSMFYDLSWLHPEQKFDVVIIDGPPGSTCALARLCGYPILAAQLHAHSRIYLDDYDRRDERKIVSLWKSWVPKLQSKILRFQKEVCELWHTEENNIES